MVLLPSVPALPLTVPVLNSGENNTQEMTTKKPNYPIVTKHYRNYKIVVIDKIQQIRNLGSVRLLIDWNLQMPQPLVSHASFMQTCSRLKPEVSGELNKSLFKKNVYFSQFISTTKTLMNEETIFIGTCLFDKYLNGQRKFCSAKVL